MRVGIGFVFALMEGEGLGQPPARWVMARRVVVFSMS